MEYDTQEEYRPPEMPLEAESLPPDELTISNMEDEAQQRQRLALVGIDPDKEGKGFVKYGLDFVCDEVPEPLPRYLLSYEGTDFSPLGNIHHIVAAAKSGKTFFSTILMAAILKGEYLGITCKIKEAKVLYIDTEQDKCDTQQIRERIKYICGWERTKTNPRFVCLNLRPYNPKQRREIAESVIYGIKPTATFIDGSRDLLQDFNDIEQSNSLIGALMKWSTESKTALWHIQHLPPSDKDRDTPRGHLGTESESKKCDSFNLSMQGNYPTSYFIAEHKSRHTPIKPIKFCIATRYFPDGTKVNVPVEYSGSSALPEKSKADERKAELEKVFNRALSQGTIYTTNEIETRLQDGNIMGDLQRTSYSKAQKDTTKARELGILVQAIEGKQGKYKLATPPGTQQSETEENNSTLPFEPMEEGAQPVF